MKKNRHKKESLLNKRVLVKWIDSNLSERTRVNTSMFVQERFLKIQRFHYENGCWLVILLLK